MKTSLLFAVLVAAVACNDSRNDISKLRSRIDSLQMQLDHTYKPGFGEIMSGIQMHHAKLWFAGINENWKLAEFEIHEIQEGLESIINFASDRAESKAIPMIFPSLDSISNSVTNRDLYRFKSGYTLLTNTCNECHQATQHEFNVVTIPVNLPVSNQDFKKQP